MKPTELRQKLLSDHARLKERARILEALASAALDGDGGASLEDALEQLSTMLEDHLATEESLLLPLLGEGGDAWMPLRLERLKDEHREQRVLLALLSRLAKDGEVFELARRSLELCRTLVEDMLEEERDLLRPELLRDDPGLLDSFGG